MKSHHLRGASFFLLAFLLTFETRAEVRLPGLFSDNMVLQQNSRVPVWGWAEDGEKVKVTFRGKSVEATARDGKWMVRLAQNRAGGPDTLVVEGKNRIELKNVLVGEVWVCSGQSNMEFPLKNSFESGPDIANSSNPNIHLFLVPKTKSDTNLNDVKASWSECGPQSVSNFSAVAYYFGRDLQKALNVPVGLIETCWGGSPAEVWMSESTLSANPDFKRDILDAYPEALQKAEAAKKGARPWKPTELYNGMIAPLLPYGIQGAIWYQGESNDRRAKQYRTLFPDLIKNWRHDWGQGDFTFLAVQLAPWDKNKKRSLEVITQQPMESSDWAELREAQSLAAITLPKTGIAVITDVGDKDDIHPRKKEPVGARLALAARGVTYGEKIAWSGPVYKKMSVNGNRINLSFDHTNGGLEAHLGKLTGFAICGEDKKFVWADASIEGSKVVVSSSEVSKPIAVRYGWSDYPVVNLWNKAGLPASPFRTDDFPLTTK